MAKQKLREVLTTPLTADYVARRAAEGWEAVAVEWEREGDEAAEFSQDVEEIPYGLQVASDCHHLEENPAEKKVLVLIMEQIVQDEPLSKVAEELNRNGHRTRQGTKWSPVAVFNLLPRLIEAGPRIFSSEQWAKRRTQLMRVM
jgi:Recombinase